MIRNTGKNTGSYALHILLYPNFHHNLKDDFCRAMIMTGKKLIHESQIGSMQSKLDQCQSGNQDTVIIRKELDLCRDELTDEQNSKEKLSQNLSSAQRNIKTLEDDNRKLDQSLLSTKQNITILKDENQKLNQD